MKHSDAHRLIRWFGKCGARYVEAYLGHIDLQRLVEDYRYALKLFFFTWAFERAGAPHGYRVAAVKAVDSMVGSCEHLQKGFQNFWKGKPNRKMNPVFDARISKININDIVTLVKDGKLDVAFDRLELKGLGHKVRAFFLRDLVCLLNAERNLEAKVENYLFCQPLDTWVRFVATKIVDTRLTKCNRGEPTRYKLSGKELVLARGLIQRCLEAGVSPISVNQGIWYFSSNAVANQNRLESLLENADPHEFAAELRLMDGFLPVRPKWG